jgi:ligand-binding SRPBCC domain-containing protein
MPARFHHVTVSSAAAAPRAAVWARIATFEGVNDELGPILAMSAPPTVTALTPDLATGQPLFRSWLRLFGILPVDYDHIGFGAIEPGEYFAERSTMGSLAIWHHDRRLHDVAGGTTVVDHLAFVPRLPGTGRIARVIVRALFRHRHRRLARHFGAIAPITSSTAVDPR